MSLQLPVKVAGVIENMSWYDHAGERLHIFGQGGGQRVSSQLTRDVGYDVPLLAQLPLDQSIRVTGEAGRPVVLNEDGSLADTRIAQQFRHIVDRLMGAGGDEEAGYRTAEGSRGKGKGQER